MLSPSDAIFNSAITSRQSGGFSSRIDFICSSFSDGGKKSVLDASARSALRYYKHRNLFPYRMLFSSVSRCGDAVPPQMQFCFGFPIDCGKEQTMRRNRALNGTRIKDSNFYLRLTPSRIFQLPERSAWHKCFFQLRCLLLLNI